jgi:bifunctional DNA-binding transcriptional regulator/antitoxin component of YhaV-PrlF toxin-antitoxin module
MDDVITMDRFGRLVLPGPVRRALGLTKPTAFRAEVIGNKVELTVISTRGGPRLKKRKGLLVVSTGGRSFNAGEVVRALTDLPARTRWLKLSAP